MPVCRYFASFQVPQELIGEGSIVCRRMFKTGEWGNGKMVSCWSGQVSNQNQCVIRPLCTRPLSLSGGLQRNLNLFHPTR